MARGPEAELQTKAIKLANEFGWLAHHTRPSLNQSGKYITAIQGNKGFPDVTFAHPKGYVMFVEFKSNVGKVSPEQQKWLDMLENAGIVTFVWRPHDWSDIVRVLTFGRGELVL